MNQEELNLVLAKHKLWLNREGGERADLRGAGLSMADLSKADLRMAELSGAILSLTNLYGVDFRGIDLSGSNLSGADLRNANLTGADLLGADLFLAVICRTKGLCTAGPLGSRGDQLVMHRQPDGTLLFWAGCFSGTEDELRARVLETYGDNKYAAQYMAALHCLKALESDLTTP
jgi:hypothetical protein